MLWFVRTKGLGKVEEAFVDASSEDQARRVADAWAATLGRRVVGLKQAIVADESILVPVSKDSGKLTTAAPIR